MNNRNVLCFESHPESMVDVRSRLQGLGYQVVAASSAKEAVDLLKEKPVEGVLLEYNLPDEICIQMQAEVKRIQPDVPVVWFAEIMVPSVVPLFEPHMQSPACETLVWEISGLDSFLRSRHSAKKA